MYYINYYKLYECNNIKYIVKTIHLFHYVLLHYYLNIHSFFNHSEPNDIGPT